LLKDFPNGELYLELDINQKQNRAFIAYNTETETPAYTLFNLGYGQKFLNNKLNLNIIVNNVLDKVYQSHQSRLKYLDVNLANGRRGVFNMGRNIVFKLSYTI
jgi:iron complex outermembrane receptor protein